MCQCEDNCCVSEQPEPQSYIGVKIVKAIPMTASERQVYFPNIKPATDDQDGYKVIYPDGYESWSPKSVFDEAYRSTNGMTFGIAVEALRKSKRVARAGWNGKGMWLRLVIPGGDDKPLDMGMENLPYIEMKTADNKLVPWLASQTDVLAVDWIIL